MKRVVSVSLGSKSRDHKAILRLMGKEIQMERIGTDGDVLAAQRLFESLDGQVDCFGVGGAILGIEIQGRTYEFQSVRKLLKNVTKTPYVDGEGIKNVIERRMIQYMEQEIGAEIPQKRGMVVSAVDRFGLASSFVDAGYEMVFADLMFVFGLPIPIRSLKGLTNLLRLIGPLATRLPMSALYPTGTNEDVIVPKFQRFYQWASVIGGDCNYIRRHLPARLENKIITTNTTTASDIQIFRERGVKYVVTSTPRLGSRSFGTNVLEAALVALAGKGRPLTHAEMEAYVHELGLRPEIAQLN